MKRHGHPPTHVAQSLPPRGGPYSIAPLDTMRRDGRSCSKKPDESEDSLGVQSVDLGPGRRYARPLFRIGVRRQGSPSMTTFDKRKDAFENKFAHDAELQFKAEARRNKLLGLWAAGLLGKTGAAADAYAKEVIAADFEKAGD